MKQELIEGSDFIVKQSEEVVKQHFKAGARRLALEKTVDIKYGSTSSLEIVLEDAEKIYQWLIKDI